MKFKIEKDGLDYVLYSITPTNFGGDAKNFIRTSSDAEVLKNTISQITGLSSDKVTFDFEAL